MAKATRMTKSGGDHTKLWMRSQYEGVSGFLWMVFVVVGLLAWFVPLVGPVASAVSFLIALIMLIAPIRALMLLEFILAHQLYTAKLAAAKRMSDRTYTDVSCPLCGYLFASAKKKSGYTLRDGESPSLTCPGCGKTSCRVRDYLLWVPHPSVSLSGDLDEYVPR